MRPGVRRRALLARIEAARSDLALSGWARDEALRDLATARAAKELQRRTIEVNDHGHRRTISAIPFAAHVDVDEAERVVAMAEAGVRLAERELAEALAELRTGEEGVIGGA